MWGILLASTGTLFEEIASLLGKIKIARREQSMYAMGFLQTLGMVSLWIILLLIKPEQFIFSRASLPTFALRAVLELVQAHYTMVAIVAADRSTYGFVRTGTIPLLLFVDLAVGYLILPHQIAGIVVIVAALLFLFINRGLTRAGIGPTVLITVNAVATLSLYKYDITHFNSIPAEQMIVQLILCAYFMLAGIWIAKENPLSLLKKPKFLTQSLAQGVAGIVDSFAYGFAPASIIIAARRSSAVVWSIVAGNRYFDEKKLALKLVGVVVVILGIILLI